MSVSVYLSNQLVQVVTGSRGKKGKVSQVYSVMAPEGSIINGTVMNANSFADFLRDFWTKNQLPTKDIYVVVNSNKIAGKAVELPALNKLKTTEFLIRDFADMERDENENLLAYAPIAVKPGSKMKYVYAGYAPKEIVKDYMSIFTDAGLTLKGVYSSEASLISLIQKTVPASLKTFVVQVMNGNIATNALWVDGAFNYINNVRIFSEVGSTEYYEEAARTMGQLSQFMQSQKIQSPIEKIFVAGTDQNNLAFYGNMLAGQGLEAPMEIFNTPDINFQAQQVLMAVSGLYDAGLSSNFLEQEKTQAKAGQKTESMKSWYIAIAVSAAVMILIMGIAVTRNIFKQGDLDELKDYNNQPSIQQDIANYDFLASESDALMAQSYSLENVVKSLDTYPVYTDKLESILTKTAQGYADISIDSFDAEGGIVSVTATAPKVEDVNKYIARLMQEDIFKDVSYTGYSKNADGKWDIHVQCILNEAAGK